MAGLRELRNRIKSIKSTRKITYAMKLVSATKLRKAQESATSAREYSNDLWRLLNKVLADSLGELTHPLTAQHSEIKKICLVVITGNRGLCGAYNANVNKAAFSIIKKYRVEKPEVEVDALVLGKKSAEFYRTKKLSYSYAYENLSEEPKTWPITEICQKLEDGYSSGQYDEVHLIYTVAKSAMSMKVKVEKILPFDLSGEVSVASSDDKSTKTNISSSVSIFEPSLDQVFSVLLPRAIRAKVRQACLEAKASEHASRMTAMDSATKNAGELNKKFTLKLNKLRQSSITGEILDIVGGAEASK